MSKRKGPAYFERKWEREDKKERWEEAIIYLMLILIFGGSFLLFFDGFLGSIGRFMFSVGVTMLFVAGMYATTKGKSGEGSESHCRHSRMADRPGIIKGIQGAIEIYHWHTGGEIRITFYGSDRKEDSVYFVMDTSDTSNQLGLISIINTGGNLKIGDGKAVFVSHKQNGDVVVQVLVSGCAKTAIFSKEKVTEIIDVLKVDYRGILLWRVKGKELLKFAKDVKKRFHAQCSPG